MFFRRAYAISVGLGMKALRGGGLFSGVGARVGSGFAVGVTGGVGGGGWPFVFAVCVVNRVFRASVRWWGLGGGALVVVWACGGVGGGRPCFSGSFKGVSGGV